MRRFRLVQPDDAEVMRDSNWVRYDSGSLVIGDLVRLVEGDVVPADCVVMSLGMGDVDDAHVVNDDDDDEDDDDGAETGGVRTTDATTRRSPSTRDSSPAKSCRPGYVDVGTARSAAALRRCITAVASCADRAWRSSSRRGNA